MKQSKYIPGDLVKANGQLCRVEEVFVNILTNENEYTLIYTNCNSSRVAIGEIEPVPLTPEILAENGWENNEVVGFKSRYIMCLKDDVMVTFDIEHGNRMSVSYCDYQGNASFTFLIME